MVIAWSGPCAKYITLTTKRAAKTTPLARLLVYLRNGGRRFYDKLVADAARLGEAKISEHSLLAIVRNKGGPINRLSCAGLNRVPSWSRPASRLSNGERVCLCFHYMCVSCALCANSSGAYVSLCHGRSAHGVALAGPHTAARRHARCVLLCTTRSTFTATAPAIRSHMWGQLWGQLWGQQTLR